MSGLSAHIGKQLRATGEVNDLDRVLEQTKLLMTIEEPQKAAGVQTSEVQEAGDSIVGQTIKATRSYCMLQGHLQRNCPLGRRCYLCGQPGHMAQLPSGKLPRDVPGGGDIPGTKPH